MLQSMQSKKKRFDRIGFWVRKRELSRVKNGKSRTEHFFPAKTKKEKKTERPKTGTKDGLESEGPLRIIARYFHRPKAEKTMGVIASQNEMDTPPFFKAFFLRSSQLQSLYSQFSNRKKNVEICNKTVLNDTENAPKPTRELG